ncbi:hypothetical protein [uncultured Proteiniphilum sp.]|jgi:hypothetical protein|nr:hypothetical protein [uncultured Proteiniphilum sp.]
MKNEKNLSEDNDYIAPEIDVVEIEIEQHILAGSGDVPDMEGENW